MKYGEKTENTWKRSHRQCMTWNMAINTEKPEKEKCTLQDLEYGEKNDKRGKGETHMVVPEIWRETLKNMKKEKCTLLDLE